MAAGCSQFSFALSSGVLFGGTNGFSCTGGKFSEPGPKQHPNAPERNLRVLRTETVLGVALYKQVVLFHVPDTVTPSFLPELINHYDWVILDMAYFGRKEALSAVNLRVRNDNAGHGIVAEPPQGPSKDAVDRQNLSVVLENAAGFYSIEFC
ncbi:hypothetical protein EV363DRAFT_1256961 [Boletus edulis]|uniref:Uncharacterized protein n=1 Tax=Boletus edulis BED1 TaxID=1328754 RepID=A0AAD4BX25_BOLED|nr:hypothetical protein EV363DRAFT_1256961 [Boletus edulis]KAF8442382.1 hypothetical protein L210DRAFT_1054278 [Boletus edulis BED1]